MTTSDFFESKISHSTSSRVDTIQWAKVHDDAPADDGLDGDDGGPVFDLCGSGRRLRMALHAGDPVIWETPGSPGRPGKIHWKLEEIM